MFFWRFCEQAAANCLKPFSPTQVTKYNVKFVLYNAGELLTTKGEHYTDISILVHLLRNVRDLERINMK